MIVFRDDLWSIGKENLIGRSIKNYPLDRFVERTERKFWLASVLKLYKKFRS